MKSIMYKEELCALCPQIEMRSKSRVAAIVSTLFAVAIIAASAMIKDMEDLSTVLMTVGVVALVASLAKLFGPGKKLTYRPSGERVMRVTLSHTQEVAQELESALSRGDYKQVVALASKESAPLMTIVYRTPSGSLFAGQSFQYIPYEYQPLTKAYLFAKQ